MKQRPSVLLVDDDQDTREMYGWSLELRGFDVTGVGSVGSAMACAETRPPDVIVTDFTLPGEDGFSLGDQLRASRALGDTPLVLVSGRAFVGDSGTRAAEIFDRILLKPVLPDDLIGEIVPLLLDRVAARLERQLRSVRQSVAQVPVRSGIGHVLDAVDAAAAWGPPPAALVADGTARYIAVNDAACELTGRSRPELLGLSVWDLTPEINVADGRQLWARFVASGASSGAYHLRTPSGADISATYAAAANILPGCHLSLLHPLPPALVV